MGTTAAPERVPGEAAMLASVRVDDGWALIEQFSGLVRDSGTEQERVAVEQVAARLSAWGIPHTLHTPELFISLPRAATLSVDGVAFAAKTPAMSASTGPDGAVTAQVVHEPTGPRATIEDIFKPYASSDLDVRGKVVICEGQPMGAKTSELQARGAVGVIFAHPGERVHEGIVTTSWGSPDLTSYDRKPQIPVVSVSGPDGERIVAAVDAGGGVATLTTELDEGWREIPVLVAEIEGAVEPERFVLLHGHLDSWHVGIGDNATGDATLLEVARALHGARAALPRSVRVCWWSGHSHGRYAGSAWYAEAFALELERDCVCHVNCDSPGCRDADAYEAVHWMAETEELAKGAIEELTGRAAGGSPPIRGGDISFNNLGVSTFFMLSSHMSREEQGKRGLYPVGGCGGNNEWHHEDDLLDIADREVLLRDMRLYAGAVMRAASMPLHPLDFRATAAQLSELLDGYQERLAPFADLARTRGLLDELTAALQPFTAAARGAETIEQARPYNDVLIGLSRLLVPLLYAHDGRYRQDPADYIPLLPAYGRAELWVGRVPDQVIRTELARARNEVDATLTEAIALVGSVG